jgi:hypothetical protein
MKIPKEVDGALRSFIASCTRRNPFRGLFRHKAGIVLTDDAGDRPWGLVEREILSMSWESGMPSSSISWGSFVFEEWQILVHSNDSDGEPSDTGPRRVFVTASTCAT